MPSIARILPGYPTLTSEEKNLESIHDELERELLHARQRLESVETLADSSVRDSRLLAEYLEKDLEHLGQRLDELEKSAEQVRSPGWLSRFLQKFRAPNPENLQELHRFSVESEDKGSALSGGLRQASARLDSLEDRWKSIRPAYLTSRDHYLRRLRRITWITLGIILLALFSGYRFYRDQPQQKFERKHLQPLKSVLDPETYGRMESLARASRSDFLRVEDLIKIRIGLETFHQSQGHFPGSQGQLFNSGGDAGPDWIPEIRSVVPAQLPVDRRSSTEANKQYLYITNGQQYKILAQSPDSCEAVKTSMPEIIDPVRGCDAIGFWTDGGRNL